MFVCFLRKLTIKDLIAIKRKLIFIAVAVAFSIIFAIAAEHGITNYSMKNCTRVQTGDIRSLSDICEFSEAKFTTKGYYKEADEEKTMLAFTFPQTLIGSVSIKFKEPFEKETFVRLFLQSNEKYIQLACEPNSSVFMVSIPKKEYSMMGIYIEDEYEIKEILYSENNIEVIRPGCNYTRMFIIMAVLAAASVLTGIFVPSAADAAARSVRAAVSYLSKHRKRILVSAAVLAGGMGFSVLITWLPTFLTGRPYVFVNSFGYAAAIFSVYLLYIFRNEIENKPEKVVCLLILVCGFGTALSSPSTTRISFDDESHYFFSVLRSYDLSDKSVITEADLALHKMEHNCSGDNFVPETVIEADKALDYMYTNGNYYLTETDQEHPYQKISHVPTGITVALFRMAGLPLTWIFKLSKLINTVIYAVIIYFAIKKATQRKMLLAVTAMFPQTLFCAANYSYDHWVNAFICLGFVYFFEELIHLDQKLSVKNEVIIIASLALGVIPKAIYFPLMLMLLFMPMEKFKDKRSLIIYRIAVIAALCYIICSFMIPFLTNPDSQTDIRIQKDNGNDAVGQVKYILSNPISYAGDLLWYVAEFCSINAWRGMVGSFCYAGKVPYSAITIVLILFIFVLLYDTEYNGQYKFEINRKKEIVFRASLILMAFVSICMIVTAIYISWSKVGGEVGGGVQDRYLTPFVIPVSYAFKNTFFRKKRELKHYNLIVISIMTFIYYESLYVNVLARYV